MVAILESKKSSAWLLFKIWFPQPSERQYLMHRLSFLALSGTFSLHFSFLILFSVYLVLGFLYQRFVAGAKGLEQIPNYGMWKSFGNLQAVS
jgi:hypothetical protein